MRNAVKMMKLIAIFTVLANLFGCKMPDLHMLDGPGMVYVDSEHRTEYANTLPFDEIEEYPYCAARTVGDQPALLERGRCKAPAPYYFYKIRQTWFAGVQVILTCRGV